MDHAAVRPETVALHWAILRLCKGILSAWERWLKVYASDAPRQEAPADDRLT
jgi:hypothetical protein